MLAQDTAPYSDGWSRSDLHAWESQTRESKGTSWRQTPKGRKKGGCCTLPQQPTNHAPGLHGANWILSRKYITCQCVRAPLASLGRGATGWSGDAEGVGGERKELGRCQKKKKSEQTQRTLTRTGKRADGPDRTDGRCLYLHQSQAIIQYTARWGGSRAGGSGARESSGWWWPNKHGQLWFVHSGGDAAPLPFGVSTDFHRNLAQCAADIWSVVQSPVTF